MVPIPPEKSIPPPSSSDEILEEDTVEGLADVQYAEAATRSISEEEQQGNDPFRDFWSSREDLVTLAYAIATGAIVATSVFIFDVSIQYIHDLPDIFAQVWRGV
jgi:hypothetical protein